MSVKMRIPPLLRQLLKCQELVEVTGHDIQECLDNLAVQFPVIKQWLYNKQGELFPYVHIYINGEQASAHELTKPLKDGDEVLILIMVVGG